MHRHTSFLAQIAILTILVSPGSLDPGSINIPDPGRTASSNRPRLTQEQSEFVTWGETQFIDAGLVPPQVRFVFHRDTTGCDLHRGLYHPDSQTVEICNTNPQTLIHELAHAWVENHLNERAKAAFMEYRDLNVWNDHSVPWNQRATEQAATILAWGIEKESQLVTWVEPDGTPILRLLVIPSSTLPELGAAYLMLTGIPANPERFKADRVPQADFSPEGARTTAG